jgi:CHASE2 domain-containing sensor protein
LIKLDRDTRRVPLQWPAFEDDGTSPQLIPTLSFQAAQLANPKILERRRLKRILASGRQPFSRFNSSSIQQYSALELLCGVGASNATPWESCTEEATPKTRELNGKIVVIGDHGDADRHESILGVSYGVDLQANYVAAILADDLYIPLLDNVNGAVFAVLWFVLVQFIFFANHKLLRAVTICLAIWVSIFLASLCLLAFGGYMLTFWFQGVNLTSIGLTWMEHWLHSLQSKERPEQEPSTEGSGPPFTGFDSVS